MGQKTKEYELCKRSLRTLEMPEEVEDSLIEHGFGSPFHIVKKPKRRFMQEAERALGMRPEEAAKLYKQADKVSQKALHLYMNLKTTLGSDYYRAMKTNVVTDEFKNEFEEMVNYQQLFGSLDYVEGEDWNTIFGPAAYFVDLMRIVDRYITGACKDIPKGYTLGERRPDLEQIVLSQANAEGMVPYLKIVNERLRDAVKNWLKTEDPERSLAELNHLPGLPVNLPLEDIRLLLKQKGTSLEQIYRTCLGEEAEAVMLESLSLTSDGYYRVLGAEGDRKQAILRLGNMLCLSSEHLDWVLTCFSFSGTLDESFLRRTANCMYLYRKMNLDFYDFMSLFYPLRTNVAHSPFDRIFNQELFPYHPKYDGNPDYTDSVLVWGQDEDSQIVNWLSGCLKIKTEELKKLAAYLFDQQKIELSVENLSRLYGHTVFAQFLRLNISEYLTFLSLHGEERELNEKLVMRYLENSKKLERYNLTVYDAGFGCRARITPYCGLNYTKDSLSHFIAYGAHMSGEDYSEQIIRETAGFFGVDEEVIRAFGNILNQMSEQKDWTTLFQLPETEKQIEALFLIINRLLFLVEKGTPVELLVAIHEHGHRYGISRLMELTLEQLFSVFEFAAFFKEFKDERQELLGCTGFQEEDFGRLCSITLWDEKTVREITDRYLTGQMSAVEKISAIKGRFALLNQLSVNLPFLDLLVTLKDKPVSDYDGIEAIRKQAAALGGDFPKQVMDARELKIRDCYLSIVCNQTKLKDTEVYKYLLIDTQMSEKTQITVLREAMNAVQLYLKRCQMGLESGVTGLEIDENWWSWIMDYNLWRANREIFIYPENYVIPSIRHTKTSLFKQVESGLLQSAVDKEYLETLYSQYFEDFSNIVEVDICAALNAEKELYLFGRTRKQPYAYYYCVGKNGQAFHEWKKIETNISSSYITPVYAGGRILLFWAQLQKDSRVVLEEMASVEHLSYRATVQYIFMNSQKQWSTPQELIKDELVYYEENEKNYVDGCSLFDGLFHMDDPIWEKVVVIPVTGKNYSPFMERDDTFERLCVFYGPLLNTVAGDFNKAPLNESVSDSSGKEFLNKMKQLACLYQNMLFQGQKGEMCAGFSAVYNLNFQKSHLLRKNEFLIFDEYSPMQKASVYSPQYSLLSHSAGVMASPYSIRDMYWGAALRLKDKTVVTINELSFMQDKYRIHAEKSRQLYKALSKAQVINTKFRGEMPQVDVSVLEKYDLKTKLIDEELLLEDILQIGYVQQVLYDSIKNKILFENGVEGNAKILSVSNQPGDFIIDTGEETFLFQVVKPDQTSPYQNLDKGLTVSFPLVSTTTLRTSSSLRGKAKDIIQGLSSKGMIEERRILKTQKCTFEDVQEISENDEEAALLFSILQNDPLVDKLIFVEERDGINAALSSRLYERFVKEGFITDQRFSLYKLYDCYDLPEMIGELLEEGQRTSLTISRIVDSISQKLEEAPVPVSLRYWTNEEYTPEQISFHIMRLSNGSMQKLKNKLEERGVKTLLSIDTQNTPIVPVLPFDRFEISDEPIFEEPRAKDGNGVDYGGLYGEYFWELFYHIPMLVAQNQKDQGNHEESRKWQEYVFSPTNQQEVIEGSTFYEKAPELFVPQKSEKVYKLLLSHNVVDPLGVVNPAYNRQLSFLNDVIPDKEVKVVQNILNNAVLVPENAYFWNFYPFRQHKPEEIYEMLSDNSPAMNIYRDDPFDPHAVARLRIGAYEKYTVMQYVDNIIAWGDREFMKNNWESLTLASMYYITAYELLGARPVSQGVRPKTKSLTYREIRATYQEIPSFLIDLVGRMDNADEADIPSDSVPFTDVSLYFGIPENEMLTKLWDVAEDRLYKLRNCLDINGNARYTETYGERLDPQMIARSVSNAQNSPAILSAPVLTRYPYRFSFLVEQAKSLANRLVSVGTQMLSVLERKDAEEIALTTGSNERLLSDMLTTVKGLQITEMQKGMESLKCSYESSADRHKYYSGLIEKDLSEGERESLVASETAFALSTAANVMKMAASAAHAIPQMGSPFAMTYGGVQIGSMLSGIADSMELGGGISSYVSGRSLTMAGYERRREEWKHQRDSVSYEMDGLKYQLESHGAKIDQAKRDLEIHKASIAQKDRMLSYLKTKFTSLQLYQWMLGRLNTVMWQTYQQAMELSLQAQEAYRYEKDSKDSFIVFENWEGAKKGLLSGENLLTALEQMRMSYFKKNERKLEIEKHISLAQCCPKAFWELKKTGKCSFDFTEAMFDYDYPGCYGRKLVTVSLSIPALLGPYQNMKAILRQVGMHRSVTNADKKGVAWLLENKGTDMPDSIRSQTAGNQCIAISKGIDDSGMFSLNFGDERYLPFEGTGVVSSWELSMPKNTNRFDFESITDIIVHVRYQAMFSESLKIEVENELSKYPVTGSLYYSLAHAKRKDWNQFRKEAGNEGAHTLSFDLSPQNEYLKNKRIKAVYVKLNPAEGQEGIRKEFSVTIGFPDGESREVLMEGCLGELLYETGLEKMAGTWKICLKGQVRLEDLELLLIYEGSYENGEKL